MYYPSNFPVELESHLITLLKKLQNRWQTGKPITLTSIRTFIRSDMKQLGIQEFHGRTPPFWWFQFLLYRHERLFDQQFIYTLRTCIVKTKIRSISGIVPLTLFTAGTGCPFNCVYCPTEPGVPKSYLSDEPAVMRAIRSSYNPYIQTQSRLIMFALSGHPIEKVEIIIKGGTFSFLPKRYRTLFVNRIFNAANTHTIQLLTSGTVRTQKEPLLKSQKRNETGHSRIIGINIETRPDYIHPAELKYLRRIGVTHVELGVQTIFNDVYTKIKRGHSVSAVHNATQMLRDAGFKIGYHLMPNLPGSTPDRDFSMMKEVFSDERYKPDHLKLYPTTITKFTTLEKWFKNGSYQPYPLEELVKIIVRAKKECIPPWVRIGRLTRDITTNMMTGNAFPPNLREIIQHELHAHHITCACIRCREIQLDNPVGEIVIRETQYKAAGGTEFFIEKIDAHNKCLGFIRLRFPSYLTNANTKPLFRSLSGSALIRELHVYGKATKIGHLEKRSAQHKGIGEELLDLAEQKTRRAAIRKIAVISGIGVRDYYRKFGYSLNQTYMVKRF